MPCTAADLLAGVGAADRRARARAAGRSVDHWRRHLLQRHQPGGVQHGRDDRAQRLAGHADVADRRAVLRGQPSMEHAAHAVQGQPRRICQPGARPCGPRSQDRVRVRGAPLRASLPHCMRMAWRQECCHSTLTPPASRHAITVVQASAPSSASMSVCILAAPHRRMSLCSLTAPRLLVSWTPGLTAVGTETRAC